MPENIKKNKDSGVQDNEDKGNMTVREAGKKGGERTALTHGREFYSRIGRAGGEVSGKRGGGASEAGESHPSGQKQSENEGE